MKTKLQFSLAITIVFLLLSGTAFLPIRVIAQEVKYVGMCNASAAVALDTKKFIVADDEDNILRIYDKNMTAKPLQTLSLSKLFPGEIQDGDDLEIDLEGAAVLGDKIFWIGSHSTSKKGKSRLARHRLFALQIKPDAGGEFVTTRVGKIYATLVADLEKDTRFKKYKIHEAKTIAPKDIGGLSIEGLAATPEGTLLIGFRNPLSEGKVENGRLVGGKALLVTLLNPLEVIGGKEARFDNPIDLDLDGYGIRSIESRNKNEYLIVAGPYHENLRTEGQKREESRLYLSSDKWSDKPRWLEKIKINDLNVEAAFFYPKDGEKYVQLLSDDGKSSCNNSFRSRAEMVETR
ncbi:MAG: DUF3616 domain-containing protein [Candidatus Contendobacter sp.]|nr:DUF3616 domain-containing protein [Candidatus Contendobacter sp.]